jgi:bifunctional non-homologous end joining protein LigD
MASAQPPRRRPDGRVDITVEGRTLSLSNLDKILYPRTGFTKGQLIDYYVRVAPALLPHLAGRPLTLKRYPNGVESEFFYEKRCPEHRPAWVRTAPIWSRHNQAVIDFCLVEDVATLVWLANLADIELHTSLSQAADIERPTSVVFDLDPGPGTDVVDCARVALDLRELFDRLGLETVVKTSGSKGMQMYVPLNTPATYEQTKPFARAVAELVERAQPDRVVSRMTKALRPGRILIDWSQNDAHKTTVSVLSLRAREEPTASTPLEWDEVADAAAAGDADALRFTHDVAVARVAAGSDPFAPMVELEQELPRLGG